MEQQNQQFIALIVEDNPICQKIMESHLSSFGYQVELASDARTAIHKIQIKNYNLIVTDLGLPDQCGSTAIRAARGCGPNQGTPLLIVSAQINEKEKKNYLDLGADHILVKPSSPQDLKTAIEQCTLTPVYQRKFSFQLKILRKKWRNLLEELALKIDEQESFLSSRTNLDDFVNKLYYVLSEALVIVEEYKKIAEYSSEKEVIFDQITVKREENGQSSDINKLKRYKGENFS